MKAIGTTTAANITTATELIMNTQIRRRPILTLNWPRNQTVEAELSVAAGTAPTVTQTADRGAYALAGGPTLNPELDAVFAYLRELRKRFKAMCRPQPLKIGVAADINSETGWPKDRIGRALGIHTKATGYLKATVEGAPRVDLTGKPVGTVSADQAAYAKSVLKAREKRKAQA